MKKKYAILAAATVLVAAVSCNKVEMGEPETKATKVSVNINVGNLEPNTKAVKTGWTTGDIINVYLDDATTYTPDFTLTYDGIKWNASEFSTEVLARLKASGGYLRGFWEGSNSCMNDPGWSRSSSSVLFPDYGKFGSSGIVCQLVADFQDISYTYSGGVLTANINSWRFGTDFQIVVSGLPYESGRYTLYSTSISSCEGINTRHWSASSYDCMVNTVGSGSSSGRIAGISNPDGVAFVGNVNGSTIASGTILTFYLLDNTTGVKYEFSKDLKVDLSSSSQTKLVAVKVPLAKFVVDMGFDSGVKWAAANLGADSFTDYGDYYAWGEWWPYYEEGYAYETPGMHWKTGYWKEAYGWASYRWGSDVRKLKKYCTSFDFGIDSANNPWRDNKTTLEPGDDAAALYNSDFRMPTSTDIAELCKSDNCESEWVTNYLGSGKNGRLFTSKKTGYENQKIFLPAAGHRLDVYLNGASTAGCYWSSSLNTETPCDARSLVFGSSTVSSNNSQRRIYGYTIRPVCD